jgi:hypothetical protein
MGSSCSWQLPVMTLQIHSLQYPILASIVRDYLAIQGLATPSERAFSNESPTDMKQCNRLSPEVVEALQILKSVYRSGHLQAADQAEAHYQALAEAMDILEDAGEEI